MVRFEIKMFKLGESIIEGIILLWLVQVGDVVNEDDVFFEVNIVKVSVEIFFFVVGKVVEILFKEGDMVLVGMVVVIVDMDGEGFGEVLEIVGFVEMVFVLKVVEVLDIVFVLKVQVEVVVFKVECWYLLVVF